MRELIELWRDYTGWLDSQITYGYRDHENKRNYTFGDFMEWLANNHRP